MVWRVLVLLGLFLMIKALNQEDSCRLQCLAIQSSECEICYQLCIQQGKQVNKFKSCNHKVCKLKTQYGCNTHLNGYLSQKQCLKTCCFDYEHQFFQSQTYDKCVQSNQQQVRKKSQKLRKKQQKEQISIFSIFVTGFTYILVGIATILFIIYALIFVCAGCQSLIQYCIKKRQKLNKKIISKLHNRACDKQIVKKMKWKPFVEVQEDISEVPTATDIKLFHQSHVCSLCKKTQINCQTSCGHNFHILCLYSDYISKNPSCPQCKDSNVNPIRVFCESCNLKESTFKIERQSQSLQKMLNFLKINCDTCIKEIESQNNLQQ